LRTTILRGNSVAYLPLKPTVKSAVTEEDMAAVYIKAYSGNERLKKGSIIIALSLKVLFKIRAIKISWGFRFLPLVLKTDRV
jgi:hypothetical protein